MENITLIRPLQLASNSGMTVVSPAICCELTDCHISIWPAGIPSSPQGTVEWAGGMINWQDPEYTAAGTYHPKHSIFSILTRRQRPLLHPHPKHQRHMLVVSRWISQSSRTLSCRSCETVATWSIIAITSPIPPLRLQKIGDPIRARWSEFRSSYGRC